MNFKLPSRYFFLILFICSVLTLGGGTIIYKVNKPFDLYIKLTEITWPPEYFRQWETILGEKYISYGVDFTFEIWNPSKKTLVYSTGNSNLLDPQIEIELEENYYISSGYIFRIELTTHEIKPGITERFGGMGITVRDYNATIPPAGTYTVWAGIVDDDFISGEPPFPVRSYKTIIYHDNNDNKIENENTPKKWGEIIPFYRKLGPSLLWTLAGGELIAIVYFYRTIHRKKKMETLENI